LRAPQPRRREGSDSVNPSKVALVVGQEFRIRLRTGRWRWLLGIWLVVLAGFTALLDLGLQTGYGGESDATQRGVPLFGFLMLFVLGAMLVISPALTSQAINGDRERGTLATLQVTRLRPAEIALGKLLAGWGVGLTALALSLPFAVYAMVQGGIEPVRMLAIYGVVAVLIGTFCAVSQALSALLARTITSALLSYVFTAVMTVGTLVAFLLAIPFTERMERRGLGLDVYTVSVTHTEDVWWLLAPNPFVIVADAAPRVPPRYSVYGDVIFMENYDPLSALSNEVRELRRPSDLSGNPVQWAEEDYPVWPYGLGFCVLLGAGSLWVTSRRLRTPSRTVSVGVRVA
jgi:ABC-2 type transport system permease protein